MPRLPFRIALFLSSYAPLFALLAYTSRRCNMALWTLVAVTVISVAALIVVMLMQRNERGPVLRIAHARPKDGDVLAYMATYLVPFLGVDMTKGDDVVVFVGFLLVLGIVYVNSNMLFVNPLLSLARFHTFDVTDPQGHQYTLITRREGIDPGIEIRPAQVSRYIRLEIHR
jgi:heme exporter protein D